MTEQPNSATVPNLPGGQSIAIELPASLDAVYANFALITHSPSELLIDFARVLPNMRARASALSGSLVVGPGLRGRGTALRIRVPI